MGMRPWNNPKDLPYGTVWVRGLNLNLRDAAELITGIDECGIATHAGSGFYFPWPYLTEVRAEYSVDRRKWYPCETEDV